MIDDIRRAPVLAALPAMGERAYGAGIAEAVAAMMPRPLQDAPGMHTESRQEGETGLKGGDSPKSVPPLCGASASISGNGGLGDDRRDWQAIALAGTRTINDLMRQRDEARAELARLRGWFDGYDGELTGEELEALRRMRERALFDRVAATMVRLLDDAIRTRDNLDADLANIGPVHQAYREVLARLDAVTKERDEAREAARQAGVGNAALWQRYDAVRAALNYAETEIIDILAAARRQVDLARGGPPERGNPAVIPRVVDLALAELERRLARDRRAAE